MGKFVNMLKAAVFYAHTDKLLPSIKQIGTICFTMVLSIISLPSYSTDLPSNATCIEDNLGTTTGSVDLEVTWNPNRIYTTWYSNGSQMTVDSAYQSCTYDAPLAPPTPSARAGYTFAGWKVRSCMTGFDVSNYSNRAAIMSHGDGTTMNTGGAYRGLGNLANEKMAALEPGQWIAVFSAYDDYNNYIELFGETICSAQNGNNHNGQYGGNVSDWTSDETTLTNASGERRYCWCRVTGYKPNGGQMCNANSSVWVFVSDEGIMDGNNLYNLCSNECSEKCGYEWAAYDATKRNILLSVIE